MKINMRQLVSRFASAAFVLALVVGPLAAHAATADEVIALTKAQWAAQNAKKPNSEALASVADDYTEFNPVLPTRVDGKALAAKFNEAGYQSGDSDLLSEMQNAKVQVYGDTAILTYNYAGVTKAADGKMRNDLAKSTRVYVKQGGRWMLVHANFAPVVAPSN